MVECMSEMKTVDYISPTTVTYRTLLSAVGNVVENEAKRRPLSATIFQRCCRDGQLDKTVLETLQRVQPELYLKLPFVNERGSVREGDIPSNWTCNVAKQGWR